MDHLPALHALRGDGRLSGPSRLVSYLARVFASAVVRKLAYILVAALLAFAGLKAHADCPGQPYYRYSDGQTHCSGGGTSASGALAQFSSCESAASNAQCTGNSLTATVGSDPGIVGQPWTIHLVFTPGSPVCGSPFSGDDTRTIEQAGPADCPTTCASGNTMDVLSAIAHNDGSIGSAGSYCVNGCSFYNAGSLLTIGHKSNYGLIGKAMTNGQSCGASNATASTPGVNCFTAQGGTQCVDDTKHVASTNGDVIDPLAPPNDGKCVSYPSGGVMCTVPAGKTVAQMPTPPAPDNGTAGQVADPDTVVTGDGKTMVYYGSAKVNNSAAPVSTNGKGTTQGTGSGNTGSGNGNGDSQEECSSATPCDGSIPELATQPTIQESTQALMNGIKGSPLVSAISSISTAVPSGECPAPTLHAFGKDYVWDSHCQILSNLAGTLGALMLVIYTIAGIRVVMSA